MKKHINRFSLVFNPIDNQQKFTMDVLNNLPQRRRSIYIAQAVVAYEQKKNKSTPTTTFTTEKRGRGRPRKNPVAETPTTVMPTPSQASLSHITQNNSLETQSMSEQTLPPSSTDIQTADDIMLVSMMRFAGEED